MILLMRKMKSLLMTIVIKAKIMMRASLSHNKIIRAMNKAREIQPNMNHKKTKKRKMKRKMTVGVSVQEQITKSLFHLIPTVITKV